MKVLFVCTGNLCRSPMAEALLRAELAARGCAGIEVASAGTWASAGSTATALAAEVLSPRGCDLSGHRSRPLEARDVAAADVVVAMTSVHAHEVEQLVPGAGGKTLLLKAVAEITPGPGASDARGRLRGLLEGLRPEPRRELDVADPVGLPWSAYERCAAELADGVRALADVLCGPGDRLRA